MTMVMLRGTHTTTVMARWKLCETGSTLVAAILVLVPSTMLLVVVSIGDESWSVQTCVCDCVCCLDLTGRGGELQLLRDYENRYFGNDVRTSLLLS